jgi:hypothetical protein
VFGRRRREQEAAAEAAREAERHALFAKLAQRPEHICPFLGLADERTGYVEGVSDDHRCFAFGDPTPLSAEQQTRVCQERGYGNCPRYLRGVLVIPTEELEALRRPRAAAPIPEPAPAPAAPPPPRRRAPIFLLLGALVLLVGGAGVYLALTRANGVADASPTPVASASASASLSQPASATAAPTPAITPVVLPSASATIPPLPTPVPDSTFTGWIVVVENGTYPAVQMNEDGTPGERTRSIFDGVSGAPVDRRDIDGTIYWVTLQGGYSGHAYVADLSGPFQIYETYEGPDGTVGFIRVPDDER